MLFVLRLLPSYKKWQQRLVYLAFLVNFLVTAYTCITFGISCIPFNANWDTVPNSKCFSKDLVVLTNQINGGTIYQSPFDDGSELLLTSHSSCVCIRHCHCFDTPMPVMERTDEGENKTAAEFHLWSRPDHFGVEHCSGDHNHPEHAL